MEPCCSGNEAEILRELDFASMYFPSLSFMFYLHAAKFLFLSGTSFFFTVTLIVLLHDASGFSESLSFFLSAVAS
jgi:hypothetical protein